MSLDSPARANLSNRAAFGDPQLGGGGGGHQNGAMVFPDGGRFAIPASTKGWHHLRGPPAPPRPCWPGLTLYGSPKLPYFGDPSLYRGASHRRGKMQRPPAQPLAVHPKIINCRASGRQQPRRQQAQSRVKSTVLAFPGSLVHQRCFFLGVRGAASGGCWRGGLILARGKSLGTSAALPLIADGRRRYWGQWGRREGLGFDSCGHSQSFSKSLKKYLRRTANGATFICSYGK